MMRGWMKAENRKRDRRWSGMQWRVHFSGLISYYG